MFSMRSFLLAAILSLGGLLFANDAARAQHHGGFGGGHGIGGFGHGYGGYGGYGYGGHGYSPYYSYSSYSYPYYGYSGYSYPNYGYSGYSYPSYGYSNSYYTSPAPTYAYGTPNPGYYGDPNAGGARSNAPGIPANIAVIELTVPASDAQVWVEGVEMASRGTTRLLESPQLDPNKEYTYTIRAAWNQGDRVVRDERQVKVTTGKMVALDLTRPAPPQQMPAPKK